MVLDPFLASYYVGDGIKTPGEMQSVRSSGGKTKPHASWEDHTEATHLLRGIPSNNLPDGPFLSARFLGFPKLVQRRNI